MMMMLTKYAIIAVIAMTVLTYMYITYKHDKEIIQRQRIELHNKDVKIQQQKQETKIKEFEAKQKVIKQQWAEKMKREKEKEKEKNETNIVNGSYTITF
jgi:cell division protein YceG involved in septum cleavage